MRKIKLSFTVDELKSLVAHVNGDIDRIVVDDGISFEELDLDRETSTKLLNRLEKRLKEVNPNI